MKRMYLYELQIDGYDIELIDVEKQPELKEEFDITSVPTTLFYKDDEVKDRIIGFMPKEKFIESMSE